MVLCWDDAPATATTEEHRTAVTPRSGLLLEHFARLAANVAGTSVAIVGVQGRRSDRSLTLAAYGLSPDRPAAILGIDKILQSESGLVAVPDLARDARFQVQSRLPELSDLRFMAHLKLLSAGGERIGFIAVLDPTPRDGLTDAQIARIAERRVRQMGGVSLDHGQIGPGIGADDMALQLAAIGKAHPNGALGRVAVRAGRDDVMIGEQKAVGREKDARAGALTPALAGATLPNLASLTLNAACPLYCCRCGV